MARKGNRASAVRRLHRGLGTLAALYLLAMAVSGWLINHSRELGLAGRFVTSETLQRWYGLEAPDHIAGYPVGDDWLSFAGPTLYLNHVEVATLAGGRGAVRHDSLLVIAGSDSSLLLDKQGRLVERVPWEQAGEIEALGTAGGSLFIRSGDATWAADAQLLGWQRLPGPPGEIGWSTPGTIPEDIRTSIVAAYRGRGLSVERLVQDVHSGRLFGPAGIWVNDLLALVVMSMAVSGLMLWLRAKPRSRRGRQS